MLIRETQLRPNSLHDSARSNIRRTDQAPVAWHEAARQEAAPALPPPAPLWRGRGGGMQTNAVFRPRAWLAFNGASALMRMPMTIMLNQTPRCPKGTRWVKVDLMKVIHRGCRRRNGTWHGYHKIWYYGYRSASRVEGKYVNGKKHGLWKVWCILYNDKKILEGRYVNGNKHGLWKEWYRNGKKESEERYVNGKQHGLWKEWYDNGKKKAEATFVNGKKHGAWKIWRSNGKKKWEERYVNGKNHGTSMRWDKHGALERIKNYVRGVLHGKYWRRLASGGSIEGYYRNGKLHGAVVTKDRSGKVVQRCTNKGCTP